MTRFRTDHVSPVDTIPKAPLLTAHQERLLGAAIADGDTDARDELVVRNLRLVVNIAKKYINRGVPLEDLIQEGNAGLIRAADDYDVGRGTRFSTYAAYWIKQAIRAAIMSQGDAIRLPAHMHDLLRRCHKASVEIARDRGEVTHERVAEVAGLTNSQAAMVRQARKSRRVEAKTVEYDPVDSLIAFGDYDEVDQEVDQRGQMQRVVAVMGVLTDIEREVIRLRFGLEGYERTTLIEVGRVLGYTREWIRSIEKRALQKLRAAVMSPAGIEPATSCSEDRRSFH